MAELDSTPKSIQTLYGWFNEGKLFVNRRYQRKLVWTLEEKQRLIESLLKKYPVPAIILAERTVDGSYEIIDGLQRLHSIISFIENSFGTIDGKYFDVSLFPTAKDRSDNGHFAISSSLDKVSSREVSALLDYTLAISVMRGSADADIDDVFSRINTYGHRLSDQERRQAGVQDQFSEMVRELACTIRGDASENILTLDHMPSISIDLPMTKHGYGIQSDEIFWVKEGILRATDLRDSLDEQCLADIAACIGGGQLIERSKDALDGIYSAGDPENIRIETAIQLYGVDMLASEIKHCIDELLRVMADGSPVKMRELIFSKRNNNGFPAIFATLVIAFHSILIVGKKKISDYAGVKSALTNLDNHIDTGRGSTTVAKRKKNIDIVKGLVVGHLVDGDLKAVYGGQTTTDIEALIRRSQIELPNYELKQGVLSLDSDRSINHDVFKKVAKTICAIANNGKDSIGGAIFIGVSDKEKDTQRIIRLDKVEPRALGSRNVVGLAREMKVLGDTAEEYFSRWKTAISNSDISSPLKEDVLSNIDYHDFFGLGLIVISIPVQSDLSYYGEDLYIRSGDDTIAAKEAKVIAGLSKRFL